VNVSAFFARKFSGESLRNAATGEVIEIPGAVMLREFFIFTSPLGEGGARLRMLCIQSMQAGG
jgi:hypothetical protein